MAKKWYAVSVLSNFEKQVARYIESSAMEAGLENDIEVLVPTEDVIEIRRNKKINTERKFMPGYILVNMELNDQTHNLINKTNRVMGFLSAQGEPVAISDDEVSVILNRTGTGDSGPRNLVVFDVGEVIKVNDGPFEGFNATVESIDDEHQRLKVMVSIFGRLTPVELEYTQVAKN